MTLWILFPHADRTARFRRNRKTRYRKARFLNRLSDKKDWLAPSIRQKVDTHMTVVSRVCKILPVTKIIVETASFDIQKIKDPDISGTGYQHGEQLDFWNVREYVLFRDGHTSSAAKANPRIRYSMYIISRAVRLAAMLPIT